jgi:hypothetical protein
MKCRTLLPVLVLGGILLAAGCTGPLPQAVPATPASLPATDSVTAPPSPVPFPAETFWPDASRIGEYTTVPTTRIASDNPHLDLLEVRKRTFVNPLPNCLMEYVFPSIATDPAYGIRQVVPKLAAVSEEEYETFIRKYTKGDAENTELVTPAICQNTQNEPTWNFIEVRAVLVPTNVFPSEYTISRNVLSEGKIIARFETTEKLTIDRQLVLASYVPLHADEVDLFDSVDVTYTRH